MSYTIYATYTTYSTFEITADMKLLRIEENTEEAFFKHRTPGAWYIMWDTLHYIDQNGDEQELAGCTGEADYKHPDDIHEE
jgi:hypothetical protein